MMVFSLMGTLRWSGPPLNAPESPEQNGGNVSHHSGVLANGQLGNTSPRTTFHLLRGIDVESTTKRSSMEN